MYARNINTHYQKTFYNLIQQQQKLLQYLKHIEIIKNQLK